MTIYRCREEFNMVDDKPIATLTDSELKQKVSEIRRTLLEVGKRSFLDNLGQWVIISLGGV